MKRYKYVLGVSLMIMLNGCANMDSYIEERVKEVSGIYDDENYVSYQSKVASGNVDEDGFYIQKSDEIERTGSIHVTFATNSKLNVQYFEDADKSIAIDTASCYLNPGDSVYAQVEASDDVSVYEFSKFNIYAYDADGDKKDVTKLLGNTDAGLVAQIPFDYDGTELSIVPVGEYHPKEISLRDYYIEDDKTEHDLGGIWMINDEEYTDDSVKINPSSSYIISYKYDVNDFFYVSSEPECYYNNTEDGTIIFKQRTADDEPAGYMVELHPYSQASIISGVDRSVSVNNEGTQTVKENTELTISNLKYGDKVLIATDKEWKELENNKSLVWIGTEPSSTEPFKYEYTLIVPEKGSEFRFDPKEYKYDHGSLTFRYAGLPVEDIKFLEKGRRIYYETKEAEDGYWLPSGEHYIIVGEEAETREQLNDIKFVQKVQVSVHLKQPIFGGKVIYSIDGENAVSEQVDTYSGSLISMDFEPWEGWICNYKDGTQYEVNGDSIQTITVDGVDINDLFVEDNDHKPVLTIVLEKSVGEEMMFDITASGLQIDEDSYKGTWWKSDYKIVDACKIGTEENIIMSMKNKSIPTGEAVKIVVKKKVKDNNDDVPPEIWYVDDLTKLQEPICIYSDTELGHSKIWYDSINITVSKVNIENFTAFQTEPNVILTVKNDDTKHLLKEGNYVENSQKVIVTLEPKDGYYISNGNVSGGTVYQNTIKYSKYLSDIENILSKHPAEKYCEITLDKSDSFATYTYKRGKEEVNDAVAKLKQGEKLTLEYEITDDSHKLKEETGGFLGFGKSDKKVTAQIEITADYDGRIVTKEDFGIEVTEGE